MKNKNSKPIVLLEHPQMQVISWRLTALIMYPEALGLTKEK
jgi:hypothetical protein